MPVTEDGDHGEFDGTPQEVDVLVGDAAGPLTMIGFSASNKGKDGTTGETIDHSVLLRKRVGAEYFDLARGLMRPPSVEGAGICVWSEPPPYTTVVAGEKIVATLGEAQVTVAPTWSISFLRRT